jgi:hypothetical protein
MRPGVGGSAIDQRTTRHAGYGLSQGKRKRIEECFGWLKTSQGAGQGGWGLYGDPLRIAEPSWIKSFLNLFIIQNGICSVLNSATT